MKKFATIAVLIVSLFGAANAVQADPFYDSLPIWAQDVFPDSTE